MTSAYLELPLRTEAEALAERIYDNKRSHNWGWPAWPDVSETVRNLALSKARTALAKEQS